jgi:uncharacterized membrane protein
MNGKSMHDMSEQELEVLIAKLENTVVKLNYERPGSSEARFQAEELKDAKQLLHDRRKNRRGSDEPHF